MYAVYGLDKKKAKAEAFIGYVPSSFFDVFTDSSRWTVATATDLEGKEKIGRLYGRAFFVHVSHLKARLDDIISYMGPEASELFDERPRLD